jgi:hypothetical protein
MVMQVGPKGGPMLRYLQWVPVSRSCEDRTNTVED